MAGSPVFLGTWQAQAGSTGEDQGSPGLQATTKRRWAAFEHSPLTQQHSFGDTQVASGLRGQGTVEPSQCGSGSRSHGPEVPSAHLAHPPSHQEAVMPNQRKVQPAQAPPAQSSNLGQMSSRAHSGRCCPWDKLLPNTLPAGGCGSWVWKHSMTNESHKKPKPRAGMENCLIIWSFECP